MTNNIYKKIPPYKKAISIGMTLALLVLSMASCSKSPASETSPATALNSITTTAAVISTSSISAATVNSTTKNPSEKTTKGNKPESGYFKNCAFIGDSLTEGLEIYSVMKGAKIVAHIGLNTSTALTNTYDLLGKRRTVADAIGDIKPKHIYILLGSNDVEWMPEKQFIRNYTLFVQQLKAASPESVIYLQSILPVTHQYESKNPTSTNKKIDQYNADIRSIAAQTDVHYLNVAAVLKDSTGALPDNFSDDGMHLRIAGYKLWCDYIEYNEAKG